MKNSSLGPSPYKVSVLKKSQPLKCLSPIKSRPYKVALLQKPGGVAEDAGGAGGEEGEVGALRVGGFLGSPFKVGGRAVEDAFAVHDMEELAGDGGGGVDEADGGDILRGGGANLTVTSLHRSINL